MVKKPELLATARDMGELRVIIASGATAVNIGEQKYGMRLPGDFNTVQIAEAVKFAHQLGAKIIVSVNNILDNQVLAELPEYLASLQKCEIDAIVFGDPAVLYAVKQVKPTYELHWSTEMTSTNFVTANYWGRKGASRVLVSRELNLEEVLEFKRNVQMEVQVQVHGITNIYHSKRNLVQNYMAHEGKGTEHNLGKEKEMYLVELERQDQQYPVYEDKNGTHIMSSDDICVIEDLHLLLEAGIDSLKVEGLMKSVEYNETVVRAYRDAMDAYYDNPQGYEFNPEWLERIQAVQDSNRELTFGFFYKEQVY